MSKRTPYEQVRGVALWEAWRKVRENGKKSVSLETRDAVREFEASVPKHLRRIDRQLRLETFQFAPQTGILKKRPGGKRPRPLVVGAIQNRIVQRAILDVLQTIPAIVEILKTPSSFGGIRERDCREAIAAVQHSIRADSRHFIRSDIRDFFTKIPRQVVLDFLAPHISDGKFLDLTRRAMETTLANLEQLGEDATLFPALPRNVA
jgi:retron-type reverse transcriptase